jgi:hypothetical protein
MVSVREWTMERVQTLNTLLDLSLRDTDCSDDRLARILTLLGDPAIQTALDAALMQRWVRVYRLPTETVRLDSTSVSVYHDDVDADSLLQHGWSKEHRPDLRQFKLMLATLDPLGLPIGCQPVAGQRGVIFSSERHSPSRSAVWSPTSRALLLATPDGAIIMRWLNRLDPILYAKGSYPGWQP